MAFCGWDKLGRNERGDGQGGLIDRIALAGEAAVKEADCADGQ